MEYQFYVNQYKGEAIDESRWPSLCARAQEVLERYKRIYTVAGSQEQMCMAVCAMAEVMLYFARARVGQGGLRYAAVGSVSVSGKGVYESVDISPAAEERELYQCAGRYVQIYRGRCSN